MSAHVKEVGESDFESEVLQSETPVLVDFWAPWCGPCRTIGPRVEALAAELAGKLKVVKVNVDDNMDTAGTYGIRSIPTLIWFKGGQIADQWTGLLDDDALRSKTQAILG